MLPPTVVAAGELGRKIIKIDAGTIPAEGTRPFSPAVAVHKRTIGQLPHRTAPGLDMALESPARMTVGSTFYASGLPAGSPEALGLD